jgi:hypothetical protein
LKCGDTFLKTLINCYFIIVNGTGGESLYLFDVEIEFVCVDVSKKTANQYHWKEYGCGFKIIMVYSPFILIFFFFVEF